MEKDCPSGDKLWEDDGSGGVSNPFRGLTMGERRPSPRLERIDHHEQAGQSRSTAQGLTSCSTSQQCREQGASTWLYSNRSSIFVENPAFRTTSQQETEGMPMTLEVHRPVFKFLDVATSHRTLECC